MTANMWLGAFTFHSRRGVYHRARIRATRWLMAGYETAVVLFTGRL
jgi:hypothetical protein